MRKQPVTYQPCPFQCFRQEWTRGGKLQIAWYGTPGLYSRKTRAHLRGCLDSRVGHLATVPAIVAQTAQLKTLFALAFGTEGASPNLKVGQFSRDSRNWRVPSS